MQPDGKILVGGAFTMPGGGGLGTTIRNHLGRFNTDGSLDNSFNPGANNSVFTMTVQPDSKIIVGGAFTTLGSGGTGTTTRNRLGRVNADGSLDASFNPGANNTVYALAAQSDGKLVVGGNFTTLGGGGLGATTRNRLGRLTNTDAAFQRLSVTRKGGTIMWSRSGAGPEVSRVIFESSTDGVNYTALGSATHVVGGWQLTGKNLEMNTNQNLLIRARGDCQTGFSNASGSIAESVRSAYVTLSAFTDDPLVLGLTPIKAVHIAELRARIDALRMAVGLGFYSWIDALTAGTTPVRALHIIEMRAALQDAYNQVARTPPTYTDPSLGPGTTIKMTHIEELRSAVQVIE